MEEIARRRHARGRDRRRGCANAKTGAVSRLPVDGVFIAIGHTPNTAIFARPGGDGHGGLYPTDARQHPHLGRRRVRGRRRAGQDVPPGRHRGRHRLHGGAGSRKVAGRAARSPRWPPSRRRIRATKVRSHPDCMRVTHTGRAPARDRLSAPPGKAGGGRGSVMDWDKLRVFHAVAEAGSFTHAGDTLNLSQSAVSRQISALEEALAGAAVPPARARPDPDRAGRGAEPHGARGVRQAGDDRGAADREQGEAGRAAEGDHHGGVRRAPGWRRACTSSWKPIRTSR